MSKFVEKMLFFRGDRILLSLEKEEFDVTDHLAELVDELAKLKNR